MTARPLPRLNDPSREPVFLFLLSAPANARRHLPETVRDAHRHERLSGNEDIAFLDQILEPELQRVHAEVPRDPVHLRFVGPRHVGHAHAAVGTGRGKVRIDGVGGQPAIGHPVRPAGDVGSRLRIGGSGEGVSADVVEGLHLARHQTAVALEPGLDPDEPAVAASREEHFLAGEHPLNRPTGLARQQRHHRLEPGVGLAAVTAAHERNDDPNAALGQLEDPRQLLLEPHRVLARRMHHQPVGRFPNRGGHVGLDMAVLHRRRAVGVLEDLVGLGEAGVHVSVPGSIHAADVAAGVAVELLPEAGRLGLEAGLVDDRSPGLRRLHHVEDRGQGLVFRLHELHRLLRDLALFRGHCGHDVANAAHPVHGQHGLVLNGVAVVRVQAFEVVPGDDGDNTGQSRGPAHIYLDKLGVRVRAAERLGMEHARQLDIGGVLRVAGDLGVTVHPRGVAADHAHGQASFHTAARARRPRTLTRWRL